MLKINKLFLTFCIFLTSCSNQISMEDALNDEGRTLIRQSIIAHGGIDNWRNSGVLKFRWVYHMSDMGKIVDTIQFVDPVSMSALHQVANTNIEFGYNAGKYWIYPAESAFNPSPRFWSLTPIYFLGIPFVFEDDKANFEILSESIAFEGKQYLQLKITYDKSAGDSPDDYYVLLIDPVTKLTRGAYYTVTSPIVNKGNKKSQEKFISLDGLKYINGVKLSSGHKTYRMSSGVIGEQMRYTEVLDVEFLPRENIDFNIPKTSRILNLR